MRYYNNIFGKGPQSGGLALYDGREHTVHTGGNLYDPDAPKYGREQDSGSQSINLKPVLVEEDGHGYLILSVGKEINKLNSTLVNTALLGKAITPDLPFVNPDGSPLTVNRDLAGWEREANRPASGPFEMLVSGVNKFEVW